MKKLFLICLVGFFASIIFLSGWSGYHSLANDDQIESYFRFYSVDSNGAEHFNWLGVLSPLQQEAQSIKDTTFKFSVKIVYPYGKGFECIAPDSNAEFIVATQIANAISDSVAGVDFQNKFDYDGRNLTVRKAANPETRKLEKPVIALSLFGTASPEAAKYGFQESIMRDHREYENLVLAQSRLSRTADILSDMGYPAEQKDFDELQFANAVEANMAVLDRSILDTMRYVRADVTVKMQRLQVTPITAPIAFPIWLALSALGLVSLLSLIRKLRRSPKRTANKSKVSGFKFDWGCLGEVLKLFLGAIALAIIAATMITFMPWWAWVAILVVAILYVLWIFRREIWDFLKIAWQFILSLLLLIGAYFVAVWDFLDRLWRKFLICWKALPRCWRRVLIGVILYAIFATYMWLSCPC